MKQTFCAHRGVSALMPENTLPAFAASLALGADESEFDIRLTKDKKMVISHDDNLERISDGKGFVCDHTMEELRNMNIGIKHGWNIGFCEAEEVFEQFANKIVFNMHVKEHGEGGYLISELEKLIKKYDAVDNCYFAAVPTELEWMQKITPDIKRCAIQHPDFPNVWDDAVKYDCSRVQFWYGMFDQNHIQLLHSKNISCNVFFADTFENYKMYFDMGIDTILTNRMDLAAKYKEIR